MEDVRLESFPFDSKASGYDDYGYPVYDRAVGATMLRQTFAQFFSNGVFGTPGTAFELSKGEGLRVNIAEGIAIINGAMASVPEGGISVPLTDESTTVGTYAYGVFLRYDENSDKRSCYVTVRKGEAGTSPTPPEPERSAPGIWELRLGYVVVPTGSTDLSEATVTNEKGLEYCPFAMPFVEIDTSAITADFRTVANEALTELLDYFGKYKDVVDSAIDGTLAGQLQTQINELKEQLENFDLSGSVDNETIAYSVKEGEAKKTLHVIRENLLLDGIVTTEKILNGAVTTEKIAEKSISFSKLSDEVLVMTGLFDWSSATAEKIAELLDSPIYEVSRLAKENGLKIPVSEFEKFKTLGIENEFQDSKIDVTFSGYGTFTYMVIGVYHDDLSDGSGKAMFTLAPDHVAVFQDNITGGGISGGWKDCLIRSTMNSTLKESLQEDMQSVIASVKKKYTESTTGEILTSDDYIFLYSEKEVFGDTASVDEGEQYDYWKRHSTNDDRIHSLNNSPAGCWLRTVASGSQYRLIATSGNASSANVIIEYAAIPCFAIK